MDEASSSVPCNGCTLCCRQQDVFLFPDEDANGLAVEVAFTPEIMGIKPMRALRLLKTPEGDCIYLGPAGCTIYDKRPRICRMFDCREHYHLSSATRRVLEARFTPHDRIVAARGRELVERSRR